MADITTRARRFPILWPYRREEIAEYTALGCPRFVPWTLVEAHEAAAQSNHSQTLTRLAERGGLSPCELLAVLDGLRYRNMPAAESIPELLRRLATERPEEQADGE